MGNPADKADTQEERDEDSNKSEPTFADSVNDAVSKMKQDEKGNWVLPDDLDEPVKFAAMAEKRRRDTQAALTRTSQENKALKAKEKVLSKKALTNVEVKLTPEQEEELETLKFEDPEAWRKKRNGYEAAALEQHAKELDEEVSKASTSVLDEDEVERRKTVLSEFLAAHEGFDLNDDIIANDIPPRIFNKLKEKKVTFEEFLKECYDYTQTGKVIKQDEVLGQPDLGKVGGGNSPDKNAVKEDIVTSYSKETY